jgi:hypothetical protein
VPQSLDSENASQPANTVTVTTADGGRIFNNPVTPFQIWARQRAGYRQFLEHILGLPPTSYKKEVHLQGLCPEDPQANRMRQVVEIRHEPEDTEESWAAKLDAFCAVLEEVTLVIVEYPEYPPARVFHFLGE